MNILYHRVGSEKLYNQILECGYILASPHISHRGKSVICMTRDKSYLSRRKYIIVFDRDKLKYNYKVSPFCLMGYYADDHQFYSRWYNIGHRIGFESEERVFAQKIPLYLSIYHGEAANYFR